LSSAVGSAEVDRQLDAGDVRSRALPAQITNSIGPPGLLLTGSVATLICRRIARDAGAALRAWQFTAIGSVLVPAQLAVAVIGLHLTGALR